MSQKTLNSIASFDIKASNRYRYPDEELLYRNPKKHLRWDKMVDELYEPGHGNKLEIDNMKLPVRLMLIFLVHNVMPRRSDMQGVKLWDIPILYSLMTGTQLVSYRYLVMMNIWDARERKEKKIIPHCRLITALIKKFGALYSRAISIDKELSLFTCKNIHKHGWVFQKTDQYLILKYGETKTWRVRNPESQVSDDDDLDDHVMGTYGVSYSIPPQTIYTGPYQPSGSEFGDQVYPFGGGYPNMSQFVEQARPEGSSTWPAFAQEIFDQQTRGFEQQHRDARSIYDRNELWNQVHAINMQVEINQRFVDDQQRRLPDGSMIHPVPSVHQSRWLDPHQQSAGTQSNQGASSSGNVVDLSGWRTTMTGLFGDPRY